VGSTSRGAADLPATLLVIWLSPVEARRRWWLLAGVIILAPILEGVAKEITPGSPRNEPFQTSEEHNT
jgi:hypothetical protein